MKRTLLVLTLALAAATPAWAEPIGESDYRQTMAEIDALQAEMLATIDKIEASLAPEEAIGMTAHMRERLDWLRATKVKAGQADTSHAMADPMKALPSYARCIVMRAGLLDDAMQDIATDVSLRARGTPNTQLLPLDRDAVAAQAPERGCP